MRCRTVRRALLTAALLLTCSLSDQRPLAGDKATLSVAASQEVRLRKLHLVRPDLIPYPLWLEVYC